MIEISDFSPPLFSTSHPDRFISKKPSKILREIINDNPGFYSERNVALCYKTPINIIASLLLLTLKEDLNVIFSDYNYRILQDYVDYEPISLFQNYFIKPSPNSTEIIQVPHLLYKGRCGKESGLVITGELAGLIVNPVEDRATNKLYLVANRIWNDDTLLNDQINSENNYDIPNLFLKLGYGAFFNPSLQYGYEEALELYRTKFIQLTYEFSKTSEALFSLCNEVYGLEVASQMDYDNFYRTYQK